MGREGEAVRRMIPGFEQRHPHIRVRVQQIPWSAAHEKLLTAFVGEVMPDVFQIGNTWIPELVALGALEPLDDRIGGSEIVRAADYFPGILETNRIEEAFYGVPWYVDTRLLFYRSDLLERSGSTEPPRSWAEWLEIMMRVKEHVGPDRYAIFLPLDEWQTPVILALQLGADLLRDGGRYGNFQSAEFRRAFEFYVGLFRRGLAPPHGQGQIANVYQELASGYFTFYISGPWNLGEFGRRLPENLQESWATAALPSPSGDGPGVSLAGGASLALFRGSSRKDEAWQLVEYLSAPAQQVELYRACGDLPPTRRAWEAAGLAEDRRAGAFWRQLQNVRSPPKIPEWEQIASEVAQVAEAAVRGGMPIDVALAQLDRNVDAILAKRRWLLDRTARAPAGEAQ